MGVMFYVWIGIIILSIVIEILTVNLTSFWFAIGGIGALIFSCFVKDEFIYIQIGIFALLSILSVLLIRPIIIKKFSKGKSATNVEALIGKKVYVIEKVEKDKPGAIKVDGVIWTAISKDESFDMDELVLIKGVEGNKLLIEKGGK